MNCCDQGEGGGGLENKISDTRFSGTWYLTNADSRFFDVRTKLLLLSVLGTPTINNDENLLI